MWLIDWVRDFVFEDGGRKLYWFFAVAGTGFFLVSLLFSLIGFGSDETPDEPAGGGDIELGHPDIGFFLIKMFSLRSIMAFLMMFGWGGVIFAPNNAFSGFLIAFSCGLVAMIAATALLALLLKLQQNGTKTNRNLIGKNGRVYLKIPANRKPGGKVTISAGDETREVAAIADEEIQRGENVEILGYSGGSFLVKKTNHID